MIRSGRGRVATVVSIGLAAAWLAAAAVAHAPVLLPLLVGSPAHEDANLEFVVLGSAALAFVGIPAVIAGAVGVGATRHPGVPRSRQLVARAAFAVALTGPAEAIALGFLALTSSLLT